MIRLIKYYYRFVHIYTCIDADMVELVDTLDLGSSAERRVGSTPSIRTNFYFEFFYENIYKKR